jgi:polar amino acid transport system substrate-binding protein
MLAGCASAPPAPVAADPAVLRVGVCPNSPPMIFKEGERVTGVEADLAEALGRDLGRRVVFVEEKWEDLIDALDANQVDIIMSSMSITPARRYRVAFTEPYLETAQVALCRSTERYTYVLNLASQVKRGIGLKEGTTADLLVRQEFPTVKRKYYKDGDAGAAALLGRSIDLYISDAPMIWRLASLNETKGLTVVPQILSREDLGWGVQRGNPQLLDAANGFLRKARASGELRRIYSRWMPGFEQSRAESQR